MKGGGILINVSCYLQATAIDKSLLMEVYFLQTIWKWITTLLNKFYLWKKASKLSVMLLLSARQIEGRFWHFQPHNKGVMWAQLGHLEAELQRRPQFIHKSLWSLNCSPLQMNTKCETASHLAQWFELGLHDELIFTELTAASVGALDPLL